MSARDKVRETEKDRQTDTERQRQRACMHAYNDITHVYI